MEFHLEAFEYPWLGSAKSLAEEGREGRERSTLFVTNATQWALVAKAH
jgi:hypothetical protein